MDGRPELTPRERAVLEAVGRRLSNPEIAAEFFVSVRTVESHIAALRRKLGVDSRAGLLDAERGRRRTTPVLVPANSFVGRETDVTTVRQVLRDRRCVTLVGPAGCGKTRLALEMAAADPRRALVVELEHATDEEVLPAIARAAGLGPGSASDLMAACGVALAAQPHLLVVDNVDRVLATAARTTTVLMAYAPTLKVLATSRTPMGGTDETVYPVQPLDEDGAVQLFLDRAAATSAVQDLSDLAAATTVSRRLDGLPLAIELAAARVRHLTPAELADRLEHGFAALERLGDDGRHRTLEAAFDWTWDLLDDAERDLLARLSVLPGSFDFDTVEALSDGAGPDVLLRLLDRSLVAPALAEAAGAGRRFRLLASLRAFVQDRAGPELAGEVRELHTAHVTRRAVGLARAARTDDSPEQVAECTRLAPEAAAALDWALERGSELAQSLATALGVLMEQYGADDDVLRALARAAADPAFRGRASLTDLSTIGRALSYGDMGVVADLSRLAESRDASNDREALSQHYLAGLAAAYLEDRPGALAHLAVAQELAQRLDDDWMLASVRQSRGTALTTVDPAAALAEFQLSLDGYAAAGDAMHVNNARYMMASAAAAAGQRSDQAVGWAEQCATYARAVGNRHELAHALLIRARLTADVSDLPVAATTFRAVGDLRCLTRSLLLLADHSAGPERLRLLEEAHQVAARAHNATQQATALAGLVAGHWSAGAVREAAIRFGMLTALMGAAEAATLVPAELVGDLDGWGSAVAEGIAHQTGAS